METPQSRNLRRLRHFKLADALSAFKRLPDGSALAEPGVKGRNNALFYSAANLNSLRDKLVSYLRANGEITPPLCRDLTGLSRKFLIPLLEFFDSEKITIRVGDKRVLRRK